MDGRTCFVFCVLCLAAAMLFAWSEPGDLGETVACGLGVLAGLIALVNSR